MGAATLQGGAGRLIGVGSKASLESFPPSIPPKRSSNALSSEGNVGSSTGSASSDPAGGARPCERMSPKSTAGGGAMSIDPRDVPLGPFDDDGGLSVGPSIKKLPNAGGIGSPSSEKRRSASSDGAAIPTGGLEGGAGTHGDVWEGTRGLENGLCAPAEGAGGWLDGFGDGAGGGAGFAGSGPVLAS